MSDVPPVNALITEAREHSEGWERTDADGRAWRPFDQAERIRHWVGSWQTDAQRAEFDADVQRWEDVHAHDVRLKCYPEFQCAVIESYAMDLIIRLAVALESVPATTPTREEIAAAIYNADPIRDYRGQGIPWDVVVEEGSAEDWFTSADAILALLGVTPTNNEED